MSSHWQKNKTLKAFWFWVPIYNTEKRNGYSQTGGFSPDDWTGEAEVIKGAYGNFLTLS